MKLFPISNALFKIEIQENVIEFENPLGENSRTFAQIYTAKRVTFSLYFFLIFQWERGFFINRRKD